MIDDVQKYLAEMTVKLIGDRWKMQIIQTLMDGTKRFGELKKSLGDITQKVLTSNLRVLEEKGLVIGTNPQNQQPMYYTQQNMF